MNRLKSLPFDESDAESTLSLRSRHRGAAFGEHDVRTGQSTHEQSIDNP